MESDKVDEENNKEVVLAEYSYKTLHKLIKSGMWKMYCSRDFQIVSVEWSDELRRMVGYQNEEDFPNSERVFFERVHPDDWERMMQLYRKALRDTSGKIIYDTEFRIRTKSGEYRWFRSTGRMTRKKWGRAGVFYGMLTDIDEKKKTDAKLLWRDTLADVMMQNLDSVYIILDKRNRDSLYVSPSIEKIFGIRKDIPHPLLAVQDLEQPESDDFSIEEVKNLPEGQSQIKDSWIIPVGETKAKMFQKTLYHVVRGREDLLIFEFADHTHEQEIRKNIEDALEIAKSANAAKSSFLSNMSHDIRTPMNVLVGLSNLMEHELDNPQKMREYIQKIQTSSNHLLGLINDVLDMSKIESGENRMNIETFDLTEQIREIDMLIYAKYRFVITDNGIGMKKEYLEHIFEPFSRQENSVTNRVQGTGLGMAITKNIVDMMSGIIQVESEEGKGSTFEVIFEFRIDKEKEKSSPAQPRKNEINSGESDILKGKRFLCAEDKELNAEILKALLEMEGAECEICTNGEEIVERFADVREGEFDAILMDVQMPLMNGYEAARAIRPGTNPLGRTIPVIAMTANVFADDIQQSLAAGMNAHISKPMDMGVLRKTVVKVISETPQTPMVVRIAGTKEIPKPRR